MNKKGAINLSINMIIVLIIAIIILGFALSFITSMFRKASVGLEGQFPAVEVPVTAKDPIGIGNEFRLEEGEVRKVSLKVLNTLSWDIDLGETDAAAPPTNLFAVSCGNVPPAIDNYDSTVFIPSGETATVKMVIRGTSGMQNNDICKIVINSEVTNPNAPPPTLTGEIEQSFFLVTE